MRWKADPTPNHGDLRTVTGFMFFPKTIGKETRWLETAAWVEEFRVSTYAHIPDCWEPVKWSKPGLPPTENKAPFMPSYVPPKSKLPYPPPKED